MTSTKFVGLLIDTVVCLTLAKWETVSGQFGGYLTALARRPPFAVRLGSYIELLRYPSRAAILAVIYVSMITLLASCKKCLDQMTSSGCMIIT
jgi:hypothetical protein